MVAVMEIEGDDGSRIELKTDDFKTVFGRDLGFNTKDRTISRRHVLFKHEKNNHHQTEPWVSFQVLGKNPLWVRKNGKEDEGEIKIFRKFENGEVGAGDWFCISSQSPVWFNIKRIGVAEDLESESLERNYLFKIDPVKEFGFLVTGHEFDCYPKQRIKDVKNWDWFIQEHDQNDTDDDDDDGSLENKKKRRRVKKRGDKDNDDDDWSGEREEDKEIVGKLRKVERSKYSTRSKDKSKTKDTAARKKHSLQKKTTSLDNEEEEEEEEDETLGGFIVNDDGDDEDQVRERDEEEELTDDDEEELDD